MWKYRTLEFYPRIYALKIWNNVKNRVCRCYKTKKKLPRIRSLPPYASIFMACAKTAKIQDLSRKNLIIPRRHTHLNSALQSRSSPSALKEKKKPLQRRAARKISHANGHHIHSVKGAPVEA